MSKLRLIAVSQENYDSLRKFGEFQDSFNDVISKILDKIDTLPNSHDSEDRGPGETGIKVVQN
ncbi:MAG: hypothetical protein ACM3ZS_05200 [Nitrososphaerota archaeon]|jgi:hypothetical protein|nr:hypothetical protein [Nitrososphaeraceae archaeon]